MIDMLLENEKPGYLCGAVRKQSMIHAGNAVGVGSSTALEEVFLENNSIPYAKADKDDPYEDTTLPSQILHTNSIYQKGFSLTDIGDRYTLYHTWPNGYEHFHRENSKEIITPVQRKI